MKRPLPDPYVTLPPTSVFTRTRRGGKSVYSVDTEALDRVLNSRPNSVGMWDLFGLEYDVRSAHMRPPRVRSNHWTVVTAVLALAATFLIFMAVIDPGSVRAMLGVK